MRADRPSPSTPRRVTSASAASSDPENRRATREARSNRGNSDALPSPGGSQLCVGVGNADCLFAGAFRASGRDRASRARLRLCRQTARVPASSKMYPSRTRESPKSRHRRQHYRPICRAFVRHRVFHGRATLVRPGLTARLVRLVHRQARLLPRLLSTSIPFHLAAKARVGRPVSVSGGIPIGECEDLTAREMKSSQEESALRCHHRRRLPA